MLDATSIHRFFPALDNEELLHLALHANAAGQPHAALTYLKDLLQQDPKNAKALYLLGVQHAQIGLHKRAIVDMTAALMLEPGLEIARFQLGLLLLDCNQPVEAKRHLSLLESSADRALRSYAQALVALADNERARARDLLAQALAQTSSNPALSALMQRLHGSLAEKSEASPSSSTAASDERVFMGAYRESPSR